MSPLDPLLRMLREGAHELRVKDGRIQVSPPAGPALRDEIRHRREEVLAFFSPQPSAEPEREEIRRVAALVGSRVRAGDREGVLEGVFRSRAIIHVPGCFLDVDLRSVSEA